MKKKRIIGCLVSVVLLSIGALCLVTGFVWVGIQEYQDLTRQVTGFDFGEYAIDGWAYSQEQIAAINEYGYPQSFSILFYHEEGPDGKQFYIRYEEWQYPLHGHCLTYENGYLLAEKSIEPYAAIPTIHRPGDFISFMNREQLAHTTDLDNWLILPVEGELMGNADLYYAEGIAFGFQNEELLFIEAMGFEDPAGLGDVVTAVEEPLSNGTKTEPFPSTGNYSIDNALLLMFSSHMRLNGEVESAQIGHGHLAALPQQTGSGNEIDALIQLYSKMITNLRNSDDYDPDLENRLVAELEEKVLALQQQAQDLENRRRRGRGDFLGRLAKGTGRFLGRVVGGLMEGAGKVGVFAIEEVAPQVLKEAIQGGVPLNAALVRKVTRELLINRVGEAIASHKAHRAERLSKVEATLDPVAQATDDAMWDLDAASETEEAYDANQEAGSGGGEGGGGNPGGNILVYDLTMAEAFNSYHGELCSTDYWDARSEDPFSLDCVDLDDGAVHLEFNTATRTVSGWVEGNGQHSNVVSGVGELSNIRGSFRVTFKDLPVVATSEFEPEVAIRFSGMGTGSGSSGGTVTFRKPGTDDYYTLSGHVFNSNPVPVAVNIYQPGMTSAGHPLALGVFSQEGPEPSNGFTYWFSFAFSQQIDVPLP